MEASNLTDLNKQVDHLFRHLSGQLTATLTRIFGPSHLHIVENVVQDAFMQAIQTWPHNGVPDNPTGWITAVAKNKALDIIRRERRFREKEEEIAEWYAALKQEGRLTSPENFSPVSDDQLRMIFLTCHPCLSRKAQVSLTLKIAGGFSIGEIARAFLSGEEATRKMVYRAKETIREKNVSFGLPPRRELSKRIEAALDVIYLIFNEGYSAHEGDLLIRRDFCDEAIRLAGFFLYGSGLSEDSKLPIVKALLALMLLHSSRITARTDGRGDPILLPDQDRSLWDRKRIDAGLRYLEESAVGEELSAYHLEAHIAAAHAVAPSYKEADWKRILGLYDRLLEMTGNPVVALNRTVALSMVEGVNVAINGLRELEKEPEMDQYYLLPATFADFYRRRNELEKAAGYYRRALALAGNAPEKRFLEKRIAECLS